MHLQGSAGNLLFATHEYDMGLPLCASHQCWIILNLPWLLHLAQDEISWNEPPCCACHSHRDEFGMMQ
jgi:hypothetical protein